MSTIARLHSVAVHQTAAFLSERLVARRLELATTGEPDVFPRVLGWLRRRGCTLSSVEYHVADRHGPGRFLVVVQVPRRHANRLGRSLENIVGVLAVRVD